jgi:hypothetical protein
VTVHIGPVRVGAPFEDEKEEVTSPSESVSTLASSGASIFAVITFIINNVQLDWCTVL